MAGFIQTGSITQCSYVPCFLPWLLIEAKAGLLYTGPSASFRGRTVKPTTSRRLSHSSVPLTTHSDADTLLLPRTKMFPNSSTGVRVSRHGWTSWINHTCMRVCRARKPEGTTEWVLSSFHISRLLAAWLGELSPPKLRLLWEKHWIMHLWREGRLAADCDTPLLLPLPPFLFTDR